MESHSYKKHRGEGGAPYPPLDASAARESRLLSGPPIHLPLPSSRPEIGRHSCFRFLTADFQLFALSSLVSALTKFASASALTSTLTKKGVGRGGASQADRRFQPVRKPHLAPVAIPDYSRAAYERLL